MLRAIAFVSFAALAPQSPADRPSFEVASIKTYPAGAPFPRDGPLGIRVSPDGVAWRYARLQSCISWAYDIPGRVIGPDWIADRYDIAAKASGPASKPQLRLMVQTLLEDRFRLKVHREMQDLPVVVLTRRRKTDPRTFTRPWPRTLRATKPQAARWSSKGRWPISQRS